MCNPNVGRPLGLVDWHATVTGPMWYKLGTRTGTRLHNITAIILILMILAVRLLRPEQLKFNSLRERCFSRDALEHAYDDGTGYGSVWNHFLV